MNLLRLLALLLVVGCVALLVSSRSLFAGGTMAPRYTRWQVTSFVLLAMVAMSVLIVQVKRGFYFQTYEGGPNHLDRATSFLEKYGILLGMYVFGVGSIYLEAHFLISNIQCFSFYFEDTRMKPDNTTDLWQLMVAFGDDDSQSGIKSEAVSNLVMTSVILVYFVLKISFLRFCRRLGHPRRNSNLHHLFLLVIAADVAVWFYVFLRESGILETYADAHQQLERKINQSLANACLTHSSLMQDEETYALEHILFPLSMEFALASLEILIHTWLMEVPSGQNQGANDEDEDTQPLLGISGTLHEPQQQLALVMQINGYDITQWKIKPKQQDDRSSEQTPAPDSANGSLESPGTIYPETSTPGETPAEVLEFSGKWIEHSDGAFLPTQENRGKALVPELACTFMVRYVFNIPSALFLGIINFVVIQYYLVHIENGLPENTFYMDHHTFDLTVKLPTILTRMICGGLPGLLASVYACAVMRTFNARRRGAQAIKGSDVLLVVAVIAMAMLACFEVYICIDGMLTPGNGVTQTVIFFFSATESFLYLPQFILQIVVIYLGERYVANVHHRYYKTLQGVLSFLALQNLLQWAVDSFLETQFLTSRSDLGDTVPAWKVFVQLVAPPCIYFRFLAVFLFLRIKNLLRQDEASDILRRTTKLTRVAENPNNQGRTVYGTELSNVSQNV